MNELYINEESYSKLTADLPKVELGVQNLYTSTTSLDSNSNNFIINKFKTVDVLHDFFNWEWLDYSLSNSLFDKKYYYYYDSIWDRQRAEDIVEFYQDCNDVIINIDYIDISNACYLEKRINKQNKEYFVSILNKKEFLNIMKRVKEKETCEQDTL